MRRLGLLGEIGDVTLAFVLHRVLRICTFDRADGCLTPELNCKGKYKNAREASIINSSFDSFSVR